MFEHVCVCAEYFAAVFMYFSDIFDCVNWNALTMFGQWPVGKVNCKCVEEDGSANGQIFNVFYRFSNSIFE